MELGSFESFEVPFPHAPRPADSSQSAKASSFQARKDSKSSTEGCFTSAFGNTPHCTAVTVPGGELACTSALRDAYNLINKRRIVNFTEA